MGPNFQPRCSDGSNLASGQPSDQQKRGVADGKTVSHAQGRSDRHGATAGTTVSSGAVRSIWLRPPVLRVTRVSHHDVRATCSVTVCSPPNGGESTGIDRFHRRCGTTKHVVLQSKTSTNRSYQNLRMIIRWSRVRGPARP
jgi:hypothetical protein